MHGFLKFQALEINLAIGFIRKPHWNALVRLAIRNYAVSWLNEAKT